MTDTKGDSVAALLRDLASFLSAHAFLYDFSNVRVLAEGRLGRLPDEWRTTLEDDQLRTAWTRKPERVPDVLRLFLQKRTDLLRRAEHFVQVADANADSTVLAGVSLNTKATPKKVAEVSAFSSLVARMCRSQGVTCLIDAGCGLALLGRALTSLHGVRVIGVESNSATCGGARTRMEKSGGVGRHEILCGRLGHAFPPPELKAEAVVGLHCCGDLTSDALDLFALRTSMDFAAVIPCCYHRSERREPRSRAGRLALASHDSAAIFSLPSLRLAAQEPLQRRLAADDEEFREEALAFGRRAVFEAWMRQEGLPEACRARRRPVRRPGLLSSTDYYRKALTGYGVCGEDDVEALLPSLLQFEEEECGLGVFTVLANLNLMQLSLQSSLEFFHLLDQASFMREKGFEVEVAQIFDLALSPRNKVIACVRPRWSSPRRTVTRL